MTTGIDFAARQVSFDELLDDLPRRYARDLFHCHLAACLSAVFPDGEDYFVRSVRSFRGSVTDPRLKKEVNAFIGQEAIHGREHRALNERLVDLGYSIRWVENFSQWVLTQRERFESPMSNLAATAALEHFTATFAEAVMQEGVADELVYHEGIRDIFLWHALEECEHKAVAFDVFRAAGGTERTRKRVMNRTIATFITGMTIFVTVSLLRDPAFYRPRNLIGVVRAIRRSPVISRTVWRQIRAYNRTDFHPNDIDTRDLVERFEAELFGLDGRLTSHLRQAAA